MDRWIDGQMKYINGQMEIWIDGNKMQDMYKIDGQMKQIDGWIDR